MFPPSGSYKGSAVHLWLEVPGLPGWLAILTERLACLRMAPSCPHVDMSIAREHPKGVDGQGFLASSVHLFLESSPSFLWQFFHCFYYGLQGGP